MSDLFDDDDLSAALDVANKSGNSIDKMEELTQGSEGWFRMRLGLFTGSKFPGLMTGGRVKGQEWGETSYSVIRQVYLERDLNETGVELYIEELMAKEFRQTKWGTKFESFARAKYEEIGNCVVEETGFMKHNIFDSVGGSFDGKLFGQNKIVEIKCPYDPLVHMSNFDLEEIDEKHKYYAQIQGNIEISGADSCDFISYDPRRQRDSIKVINVPRNNDYIIRLFERIAIAEAALRYMEVGISCENSVILAIDEISNCKK